MNKKIWFGLCLGAVCAWGAEGIPEGYQPFPLKWDDTLRGVATDVSNLNVKPAGVNGRLVVKDGHFVESKTGNRVRLIGIGIGGDVLFPMSKEDAEKAAVRLAKVGVNVVRFHNLDGDRKADTLIDLSLPGSEHFVQKHLDLLDYFFAKIKEQGIYTVMGLKVNRKFRPGDDLPAGVKTAAKRVDRFNRAWIESQKRWAKQLLSHKNPYTGTTYAEDTSVLCVELNNESSLLYDGFGWVEQLPAPYKKELTGLWNRFLKKRYGTSEKLFRAWNIQRADSRENLLDETKKWSVENPSGLSLLKNTGNLVSAEIRNRTAHDWNTQLQRSGLTLENEKTFTLEWKARGSGPVSAVVSQDRTPWHNGGLLTKITLEKEWKSYRFPFRTRNLEPGHARISFGVGHANGIVEIAGLRLYPGMEPPEATLEKENIPLPTSAPRTMETDKLDFFAELDAAYAEELLAFLRRELQVKSCVIDTQIDWGGTAGLLREKHMDYVDVHAYWGHPEFTGGSWEFKPGKWKIQNEPQSPRLANGKWCALEQFSRYRIKGKPLSVSEHDYPYPHDYAVEMMPLLVCTALRQDWDMLQLFIHGAFKRLGSSLGISHMFDQTNHPGKIGFFPAAAIIFRKGLFEPAQRVAELSLPVKPWRYFGNRFDRAWTESSLRRNLLNTRQVLIPDARESGISLNVQSPGENRPEPMRVWSEENRVFFLASAQQAIVLTGHFGGKKTDAGNMTVDCKTFPGNFGAAVMVSLDDRPLTDSRSILFTFAGRFENTGVIWNKERNSTMNERGTWGRPPVLATKMTARISLKTSGPAVVYALDATGRRVRNVSASWAGGRLSFPVVPEDNAMHYEIIREEKK